MQISDFYSQYSRNTGQPVNAANMVAADKVGTLTTTVSKLPVGSIFEGNITKLSGGNVLLSLSNGQSLAARLENSIKLIPGQSMFFQVKSNDGNTMAIKPYTGGNLDNPIIKSALETAGVPITDKTTDMVNAMMKERMPINADALNDMFKTVAGLRNVSVETAVTMTKLGLPITPENASQFENYIKDSGAILKQMESFFEELPGFLSSEEFSAPTAIGVNHELLSIITDGMEDTVVIMPDENPGGGHNTFDMEPFSGSVGQTPPQTPGVSEPVISTEPGIVFSSTPMEPESENIFTFAEETGEAGEFVQVPADAAVETEVRNIPKALENPAFTDIPNYEELYDKNQIGAFMSSEDELENLADVLRPLGDLSDNEMVFDQEGNINKNLTSKQLLSLIDTELLKNAGSVDKDEVTGLLGSKEYRKLLQNVMEEQWMLKPEDVRDKETVKALYEKVNRQLSQIEKLANLTNQDNSNLTKTAGEIRNNMSFINDLNQMYTYSQIPLRMAGQNANGDLYVYTNKKALKDPDGELSAFLHLDMEHLGSTDVSVHMHKKKLKTDFFLKDDRSFALISEHMGELKAKLDALGFDAEINVSNEEKPVSFVKDFLEKDMPKSKDMVHRYSFDVRA